MHSTTVPLRAFVLLALVLPGPAAAQEIQQGSLPDTASLASGPRSEATALLEKTFLRIDVARLRIRFGTSTVDALDSLGRRSMVADSVASIALRSTDAWASLTFLWGIGFDRFLDELRRGARVSEKAGLIDEAFLQSLFEGFPVWYAPLRDRGVRDGDRMIYRIRGDTLRTIFQTVDGRVLVDQMDVGEGPRLAVLGGFLSPGSDFRDALLASLIDPEHARSHTQPKGSLWVTTILGSQWEAPGVRRSGLASW